MSRVIWKFTLDPWERWVTMPSSAAIIHAREQGSGVCVWAEVDPDALKVERKFHLGMTGSPVPTGIYCGTAQVDERPSGSLVVVHVYDTGEERPVRA